jgi:UDPglucose--hexose-1-phosphate uridylyltransferase
MFADKRGSLVSFNLRSFAFICGRILPFRGLAMTELRIDPIGGRRVYIAEDRAGRPNDFAASEHLAADVRDDDAAAVAACPFCAGNEAATPHELATVVDQRGDWLLRVVPNKFPAMSLAAGADGAVGVHEVIIESPRHVQAVLELSVEQLATVLTAYRDRLRHWAADGRMAHGLIFKNSGRAAGASLRHVHSQLVATPYVPEAVQRELDSSAEFFARQGKCIFCDLIQREIAAGERIVRREGGLAAIAAFAGRQPLETWILPEAHAARFDQTADADLAKLAAMLHGTLRALDAVIPGAAYNLILHTGPFGSAAAASYHWHWEIVPRVAQLAGFELGTGVYINPVSPEQAARRLREAWT